MMCPETLLNSESREKLPNCLCRLSVTVQQERRTYTAFLDPVRHFLVGDVFAAGELEEPIGLFLLQLDTAAALLIKFLVALPQLKQCFAAAQTLPNLLQ